MKKEGWDFGEDNEELMELAMHPQQYRAYKSGKAKADFEKDLAERKAKKAKGRIENNLPFPETEYFYSQLSKQI